MPKFSKRLLILAVLSAFAATSTGSVAAERKTEKHEEQHTEKHEDRHDEKHEDRHDEHHSGSPAVNTQKTGVITVANHGAGALTITGAPTVTKISGPGNFSIITPSTGTPCAASLVLARDGTCTIGVQYTSTSREMSVARVRLTDSGAETAYQETEIRAN